MSFKELPVGGRLERPFMAGDNLSTLGDMAKIAIAASTHTTGPDYWVDVLLPVESDELADRLTSHSWLEYVATDGSQKVFQGRTRNVVTNIIGDATGLYVVNVKPSHVDSGQNGDFSSMQPALRVIIERSPETAGL